MKALLFIALGLWALLSLLKIGDERHPLMVDACATKRANPCATIDCRAQHVRRLVERIA